MCYTKGEWKIEEMDKQFVYALGDDGYNRFDLKVQSPTTPRSELEANAKLIAAAPLQNQTLKDIYADAELLPDGRYAISEKRLQDISVALAKAKGK